MTHSFETYILCVNNWSNSLVCFYLSIISLKKKLTLKRSSWLNPLPHTPPHFFFLTIIPFSFFFLLILFHYYFFFSKCPNTFPFLFVVPFLCLLVEWTSSFLPSVDLFSNNWREYALAIVYAMNLILLTKRTNIFIIPFYYGQKRLQLLFRKFCNQNLHILYVRGKN